MGGRDGMGVEDEPAKGGGEDMRVEFERRGDFVRIVVPSCSWCGRGARRSYLRAKSLLQGYHTGT